jgi:hypothetical protein
LGKAETEMVSLQIAEGVRMNNNDGLLIGFCVDCSYINRVHLYDVKKDEQKLKKEIKKQGAIKCDRCGGPIKHEFRRGKLEINHTPDDTFELIHCPGN